MDARLFSHFSFLYNPRVVTHLNSRHLEPLRLCTSIVYPTLIKSIMIKLFVGLFFSFPLHPPLWYYSKTEERAKLHLLPFVRRKSGAHPVLLRQIETHLFIVLTRVVLKRVWLKPSLSSEKFQMMSFIQCLLRLYITYES